MNIQKFQTLHISTYQRLNLQCATISKNLYYDNLLEINIWYEKYIDNCKFACTVIKKSKSETKLHAK